MRLTIPYCKNMLVQKHRIEAQPMDCKCSIEPICYTSLRIKEELHIKTISYRKGFLASILENFKKRIIRNSVIREKTEVENSIINCIQKKQLEWFGHIQRIGIHVVNARNYDQGL